MPSTIQYHCYWAETLIRGHAGTGRRNLPRLGSLSALRQVQNYTQQILSSTPPLPNTTMPPAPITASVIPGIHFFYNHASASHWRRTLYLHVATPEEAIETLGLTDMNADALYHCLITRDLASYDSHEDTIRLDDADAGTWQTALADALSILPYSDQGVELKRHPNVAVLNVVDSRHGVYADEVWLSLDEAPISAFTGVVNHDESDDEWTDDEWTDEEWEDDL